MCGIFGYSGSKEATKLVVEGLKHLEYRGYDSSGVALQNGLNRVLVVKAKGKIKELESLLRTVSHHATTAIGHTRWATHGVPSQANAHPHLDTQDKIAVVHNGIIENYFELKDSLEKEGVRFRSETDTEVIVHLISKFYQGDLEAAVRKAAKILKGSYAIAAIASEEPGRIVAAKKDSPLVMGLGKTENYLASDVSAMLGHTRRVIFLENEEMAVLTSGGVKITNASNRPVKRYPVQIKWDAAQARKNGFPHFMLKEIFEQPGIVRNILRTRVRGAKIHFGELKIKPSQFQKIKNIVIIACGTAYHAGLVGRYVFEEWTDVPVWVETSSEFRYRNPKIGKSTLVIAISQSGETADTLAGLRVAKEKGALTLSVCNVLGSSIARETDGVVYTHAGPEISVASTKAYTAQLTILYLLALYFGGLLKSLKSSKTGATLNEFLKLPGLMQKFLDLYKKEEKLWAEKAHDFNVTYHEQLEKYFHTPEHKRKRSPDGFFLYLGRNLNYPSALEGALKLKEISYIPAEGYPAGEMKHGPIALIDENPWVICIAPQSKTYNKMISNIQEIRARGGIIVPIVTEGDKEIHNLSPRYTIEIPKVAEIFSPLLVALPLQLIAYCVAREFGEDIDQPRNLAKSVTVE